MHIMGRRSTKDGWIGRELARGNIDLQCQFLIDFQTTVIMATASMALLMAEEIKRRGIRKKINLKKITIGSERSSKAMRRRIRDLLDLEEMFDITAHVYQLITLKLT